MRHLREDITRPGGGTNAQFTRHILTFRRAEMSHYQAETETQPLMSLSVPFCVSTAVYRNPPFTPPRLNVYRTIKCIVWRNYQISPHTACDPECEASRPLVELRGNGLVFTQKRRTKRMKSTRARRHVQLGRRGEIPEREAISEPKVVLFCFFVLLYNVVSMAARDQ